MAFSPEFLQELSDRNPIEDVVGEYVNFTKRSGQNLFGLCPFHSEKTPSFSVSPSKQIYHCFGCGKGGSVINFIMEIENLGFADAVAFLARRAGMQLPEQQEDRRSRQRERMYALNRDAESRTGDSPARLLTILDEAPRRPEAFGLNCGIGPEGMLNALEILMPLCRLPVIAQPNAGCPKSVDNRMIYMCSPEYFTTYAMRFAALGVHGVGGCCGTGPEHIRDMARSVNPLNKAVRNTGHLAVTEGALPEKTPVPMREKSRFGAKLAAGEWVTNVEIVPPQGYLLDKTIEKARICREAGFDAVNIPDGPRASARVSPLVTAYRIQAEAGIEAILHFCCRDKNLIGMQADLLGCAAMGIHNILFITGDPPKLGDYPFASGVFDMDSIGMARIQSRLNRGIDLGGKAIDTVTQTLIGVGADPNAIDMKREIRRTREKIEAGAEFLITQPVFDTEPLLRFIEAVPGLSELPVIAGIWPLASYRNAEFMRNEVPGVIVPDSIMERMAKGKTKEEQRAEGIRIAREAVASIRDKVAGVQVSAPFGNVGIALKVLA